MYRPFFYPQVAGRCRVPARFPRRDANKSAEIAQTSIDYNGFSVFSKAYVILFIIYLSDESSS